MRRAFVANSGTHPEPYQFALALKEAGIAIHYGTSSTWSSDSSVSRIACSALARRTWLARQMRRRILPPGLASREIEHHAVLYEAWFQVHMFRNSPTRYNHLHAREEAFERAAARRVSKLGAEIVFAQYQVARRILGSASGGTLKVLGYPIAHHRWMEKLMRVEADQNPGWAAFLQGHALPVNSSARMDEEIAMADVILVPSSFAASTFIEEGVPAAKVKVANLAPVASMTNYQAEPVELPSEWVRGGNALKVLWAGQVTQRKGVSYLIEAVTASSGMSLLMAGDPMPGIGEVISRTPAVHLMGSQTRPSLLYLFDHADVFVLPSLAEGFPLAAIEAMAAGLVPIVSTNTFASDVVTDGVDGFIVPPRDAQAIRFALERLRDDPSLLARMRSSARERARLFTWQRYRQQVRSELALERLS